MTKITELNVEEMTIKLLESQGWKYLSPEDQESERESLGELVLRSRLHEAISRINPSVNETVREQALKIVLNLPSQNLMNNNEAFHKMLADELTE